MGAGEHPLPSALSFSGVIGRAGPERIPLGALISRERRSRVQNGRQIDLPARVERVRRKTRPCKSTAAPLPALAPGYTCEHVRRWAKAMGQQLASKYPDLIAVPRGATHQGDHVTVDYAQN